LNYIKYIITRAVANPVKRSAGQKTINMYRSSCDRNLKIYFFCITKGKSPTSFHLDQPLRAWKRILSNKHEAYGNVSTENYAHPMQIRTLGPCSTAVRVSVLD